MTKKQSSHSTLLKSFGKAVRFYRKQQDLSQEVLADKASLDRSYMSQIERGIKNATLSSIARIAAALSVSVGELLALTEKIDGASDARDSRMVPGRPLADTEAVAVATAAGADPNANVTVLIADDDADICDAVASILEDAGLASIRALSGLEAMQVLGSHRVDLLITDVRMSNGNGLELLTMVRKHYPKLPVFFITGYDDLSADEAVQRGASALFSKPFNVASFVSTIKESLRSA